MDEIAELQMQLMAAQMQDVSHKLSHRNVVQLILNLIKNNKLEVIHSSNGREYVSNEQLLKEIKEIILQHDGRVSMLEVQAACDVSMRHIEEKVQLIIAEDPTTILLQGEIMSRSYLDGVAEEVNERVQTEGRVNIASLSSQLDLPPAFLKDHINHHIGTTIHATLSGTQLYTHAFVSRVRAQIRGGLRGLSMPTALKDIAQDLSLDLKMAIAEARTMVNSGEIPGVLSGGQHPIYTPTIFKRHQQNQLQQMWETTGYVPFEFLKRLQINHPTKFLKSKFPSGIVLSSCCVAQRFVDQINEAIQQVLQSNSYANLEDQLDPPLSSDEASSLISRCVDNYNSKERNSSSGPSSGTGRECVYVLHSTILVSQGFLDSQLGKLEDLISAKAVEHVERESSAFQAASSGGAAQFRDEERAKSGSSSGGKRGKKGSGGGGGGRSGHGERGQMRKEKKSRSKKSKGKGRIQEALVQADRDDWGETHDSRRSAKGKKKAKARRHDSDSKRLRQGRGGSGSASNASRRRGASAVLKTHDIIETLRSSWSGPLEDDFIVDLASHLRARANRKLGEKVDLLQKHSSQRGLHPKLSELMEQLSDHFSVYAHSINILRGKATENLEEDSELVALLNAYLIRTLGKQGLNLLLNNQVYAANLSLPGGDSKASVKTLDPDDVDLLTPRTSQQQHWIIDNIGDHQRSMKSALKALQTAIKTRDPPMYMKALVEACEVFQLRIRKLDGKKLRNLIFTIRRGLMGKVKVEVAADARMLFQCTLLILHSQITTGMVHLPGKLVGRLLPLVRAKLDPGTFEALKRTDEILQQMDQQQHTPEQSPNQVESNRQSVELLSSAEEEEPLLKELQSLLSLLRAAAADPKKYIV
ncbi:hypothetical protein AAMO2058_001198300 [Amorphochlora amoebiformis]